jgi:hypothetical protein
MLHEYRRAAILVGAASANLPEELADRRNLNNLRVQ